MVPRVALKLRGCFGSAVASSPGEAVEHSCLGLVRDHGRKCITTLSTLTGILASQIENLITRYDCVEEASLHSFRHSF